MNESIFREYDIRGIYPSEINESSISLIAKAISIICDQENVKELCIGRDGRSSGQSLLDSLEKSLSNFGINIQFIKFFCFRIFKISDIFNFFYIQFF